MGPVPAEVVKTCATCGGQFPADALFCPVDGTPLRRASGTEIPNESDPYLKSELAGHIEIKQLAGIGAMGRVYRAFQRGIERDVAVKILHRELSSNPQLVTRFTREAKVASKLQHPNVVSVLLTGQMPDGALYIVMEFLDGMSLMSALAAAGGALPLPRALHIAVQLADAVGEAHAQGIIHRDLKPENVMLVRRGEDRDFVKVLDFGIARVHWGEQSMATAAGLIFGTARYISPEGARGEAVTAASDVYSIATLAYQMISGRTPFEGDQAVGLLVQQIHDKPPDLRTLPRASYVPEPIADVIMQGLAKDPSQRERDARSFGRALIDAARAGGLSSDEISRPIIAGRPSTASLPSKERTKQHDLSNDVRERMGSVPSDPRAGSSTEPRLTPEVQSDQRGASRGSLGAQGNATVKWTPPLNIAAQLSKDAPRADSSPAMPDAYSPESPAAVAQPRVSTRERESRPKAALDATMDDAVYEAGSQPSLPRTDYATPGPEYAAEHAIREHAYHERSPAPALAPSAPRPSTPAPTPAPPPAPEGAPRQTYPSKPPSNVDTTLSDVEVARRGKLRAIALVLACFVLGAGAATIVAYRMGRIGPEAGHEELVLLAQAALSANHLTDPPGDNVRDITDTGQKRWPDDSRFPSLRKRAAEELTARAIAAHATGDSTEGLRLIHLAVDMDADNASAKKLAADWEAEAAGPRPDEPRAAQTATKPLSSPAPRASGGALTTGPRLAFDVSNPRPRLGSAVDFSARITGAKKVEDAHIAIISPQSASGGGVSVVATGDSGTYHAGFTFLEAGRYEVVFFAKVDGTNMKSSPRLVNAGDAVAPPATQTAAPPDTATPAPSATVKWM